jgi:hypothetical protein
MVKAFGSRLNHSLATFRYRPVLLRDIQANEIKLAGMQVPVYINSVAKTAIDESIREAFVFWISN